MIYRLILLLFIINIFCKDLTAQFNIKVGYNGRYTEATVVNAIFNRYNLVNPNFEEPFSKVNILHGLEAGIRYKFSDFTGMEFTWVNAQSGKITSFGQTFPGEPFFTERWAVSNTEFTLGLESYPLNNFGFGVAAGLSRLKTIRNIPDVNRRRVVTSESVPIVKFNLIFQIKTRSMGFAIKPFYALTLDDFDLYRMDRELNPMLSADPNNFKESLKSFGVSMVFYNGVQ